MNSGKELENALAGQELFAMEEYDDTDESLDLDELEANLQDQLEEEFADLALLKEDEEKIGNPDALGETIKGVVWEQFINQIAVTAGEDFIKENHGLTLDLSNDAHIQTAENFEQQKYATHNTHVDYKSRGEEYRSNFYTDPNNKPKAKQKQEQRFNKKTNTWEHFDPVDGEWKKTLQKDYRKPYEKDRQKDAKNKYGNKTVNKDHQVSDAEIARDARAGAFMTTDEKVKMANSDDNLYDLDSAANQSKSDHNGEKWVKHKRTGSKGEGQTNGEYYGIDEEKYAEQDKKARKKANETVDEKEAENIELGKQSQKEEAFRMGGKALRTALMQLLAELVKEIIGKLVAWLKSAEKTIKTLLESIKNAIMSFISKLKTHLLNVGNTVATTIATAIVGPVFGLIKKVWTMLKQGWSILKQAIAFFKDPNNKNMPFDRKLLEVGKIVIAGLTGVSAIALGQVIESGLKAIPGIGVVFAFEIPLLGSLASLLGIFLGAVVAGIIGAIALNLINRRIANQQKNENIISQIDKQNEIISLQNKLTDVKVRQVLSEKERVAIAMAERRQAAKDEIEVALSTIYQSDGDENLSEEVDRVSDEFSALRNMLEEQNEE